MMAELIPDRLAELRRIAEAWLQVNRGLKDYIHIFDPTTVLELLDALAAARAEAERWQARYEALRAAVIRAEADYASRTDGLDDTLMILRQLLAEVGGGFDERV